MKKILVVTSKLPYPTTGADEADRFEGVRLLKEAGYDVSVIAKTAHYQKPEDASRMSTELNVPVVTVPYLNRGFTTERLFDLRWIDGAAYEYTDENLHTAITDAIDSFRPEIVWLDGSFMWPLIPFIHERGLKVIVRSLQIESTHVFADEGWSIPNVIRAFGKSLGEETMAKSADSVIAINRNEEELYRKMGARKVTTIPLRQLPKILEEGSIEYRDSRPLHVLFTASTFSVKHNREGAHKVLKDIAPALEKAAPGEFLIHITGAKLDAETLQHIPANVVYEGYVADFSTFMKKMDIAITQSLGVVGMHGKLFAPVAYGIPTVTVPYALAGFPFKGGEHILSGETPEETVEELLSLRSLEAREKIGRAGRTLSEELFSRDVLIETLRTVLDTL